MEKTNLFKIGDLVTLKGFDKLTIQEKPMGIIIKLGHSKVLIDWSNQVLADLENHKYEIVYLLGVDNLKFKVYS